MSDTCANCGSGFFCPHCGGCVDCRPEACPAHPRLCETCGTPLTAAAQPCPSCGASLQAL